VVGVRVGGGTNVGVGVSEGIAVTEAVRVGEIAVEVGAASVAVGLGRGVGLGESVGVAWTTGLKEAVGLDVAVGLSVGVSALAKATTVLVVPTTSVADGVARNGRSVGAIAGEATTVGSGEFGNGVTRIATGVVASLGKVEASRAIRLIRTRVVVGSIVSVGGTSVGTATS
jgi:hypothetical protein